MMIFCQTVMDLIREAINIADSFTDSEPTVNETDAWLTMKESAADLLGIVNLLNACVAELDVPEAIRKHLDKVKVQKGVAT